MNTVDSLMKNLSQKILMKFMPEFDDKNSRKIGKISEQTQNFLYKKLKVRKLELSIKSNRLQNCREKRVNEWTI